MRRGDRVLTNAIQTDGLTAEELAFAVFLQGALNRRQKSVFLDIDRYADYLLKKPVYTDLWALAENSASLFDGMAVYDLLPGDVSVNLAATACAAENWLGVPRPLAEKVSGYGLKCVFDTAEIKGNEVERQRSVWLRFRDKLKKNCLVHQVTAEGGGRYGLRDYAIAAGAFTFFARPDRDSAFLREVLGWADKGIPVYGWTTDELGFVRELSLFGDYLVPSDWSCNHSYFAGKRFVRVCQKGRTAPPEADPTKHYLAIVVSDGDNVQWLERSFAGESLYGQRIRHPGDYKMSWTMAPLLGKICPAALRDIYGKAGKDTFVCGVSGIGYTNCMTFPDSRLPGFAVQTAKGMEYADLRVLALLDNIENVSEEEARRRLSCFARQKNIIGGIWELDPDRYESGKGRIFWACGKPFVSVGISLWHPSCSHEGVTREWLDTVAENIASRSADLHSERGYTVLNVHPWSMTMEDVDYVVSRLPGHICIVSAEELITLIAQNVVR